MCSCLDVGGSVRSKCSLLYIYSIARLELREELIGRALEQLGVAHAWLGSGIELGLGCGGWCVLAAVVVLVGVRRVGRYRYCRARVHVACARSRGAQTFFWG